MSPDPRPAPYGSEDDPRVDVLAAHLSGAFWVNLDDSNREVVRTGARDLLARLDAAAPARDDTKVALPDPEGIERDGSMHWTVHDHTGDDEYGAEGETWTVQLDPGGVVHLDGHPIAPAADLARALLAAAQVRGRLGATTHTPEEG